MVPTPLEWLRKRLYPAGTVPPRWLKDGALSDGNQPSARNWFRTTDVLCGTYWFRTRLYSLVHSLLRVNGTERLASPQRADSATTALKISVLRRWSRAAAPVGVSGPPE